MMSVKQQLMRSLFKNSLHDDEELLLQDITNIIKNKETELQNLLLKTPNKPILLIEKNDLAQNSLIMNLNLKRYKYPNYVPKSFKEGLKFETRRKLSSQIRDILKLDFIPKIICLDGNDEDSGQILMIQNDLKEFINSS